MKTCEYNGCYQVCMLMDFNKQHHKKITTSQGYCAKRALATHSKSTDTLKRVAQSTIIGKIIEIAIKATVGIAF